MEKFNENYIKHIQRKFNGSATKFIYKHSWTLLLSLSKETSCERIACNTYVHGVAEFDWGHHPDCGRGRASDGWALTVGCLFPQQPTSVGLNSYTEAHRQKDYHLPSEPSLWHYPEENSTKATAIVNFSTLLIMLRCMHSHIHTHLV